MGRKTEITLMNLKVSDTEEIENTEEYVMPSIVAKGVYLELSNVQMELCSNQLVELVSQGIILLDCAVSFIAIQISKRFTVFQTILRNVHIQSSSLMSLIDVKTLPKSHVDRVHKSKTTVSTS